MSGSLQARNLEQDPRHRGLDEALVGTVVEAKSDLYGSPSCRLRGPQRDQTPTHGGSNQAYRRPWLRTFAVQTPEFSLGGPAADLTPLVGDRNVLNPSRSFQPSHGLRCGALRSPRLGVAR
jgi:hypothetical protein